ncbi:MAG: DUF3109 family protein [Microscillaceae bacterium]|nr:DUF3109 family protein [Microscillaceae bacterium]MDW8460224.1 DUF3109 family protein [Cytophagales bacterium]
MLIVEHVYISDDVIEQAFVCHLEKCKGACCVEGDAGAPLELSEIEWIEKNFEKIKPFLRKEALEVIAKEGFYVLDREGDFCTPTVASRECVYGSYNQQGIFECGFEKAYHAGHTDFKKPISCHLYPIRILKLGKEEALNYHEWHVCSAACSLGKALQVPVYQFLKEALIRKYGEAWYAQLERTVREVQENQKG